MDSDFRRPSQVFRMESKFRGLRYGLLCTQPRCHHRKIDLLECGTVLSYRHRPVSIWLENRGASCRTWRAGRTMDDQSAPSATPLQEQAVVAATSPKVRRLAQTMQLAFAHWASVSTNRSTRSLNHDQAPHGSRVSAGLSGRADAATAARPSCGEYPAQHRRQN